VAGGAALAGTAGAGAPPSTPICPSSTANGRFVRYLYLNIMFRCPDASGGAYWTAKLDNGTPRSAVSNALDMSTENVVDNNVMPLYHDLLGRVPTSTELASGVDSIRSTRSDADLISFLISKDEVFSHYASFNDWLNDVYEGVLDRPADTNGLNFFNDYVSDPSTAGERRGVVKTLEHSPENAADWTAAAMGAAFGRGPDQGGMAYWTGWLQGEGHWQTFRMWTLMLASSEGYALAQTQPNPEEHSAAPRAMAPSFPRS
jgi:hypothetical protein